jgi:hypothetical protein
VIFVPGCDSNHKLSNPSVTLLECVSDCNKNFAIGTR